MLKLDNDLLDELGLGGLPDDQKQAMLQYIYEILELRVGTNLANQMTDDQLDEFEKFIDDKGEANQAQALQWLEANLPNYKQVVNEVFEQLKVEIRQMAPQLLAATPQQLERAAGVSPTSMVPPAGYGPMPASPQAHQNPYAAPQPFAMQPPLPQQNPYQQTVPSSAPDPSAVPMYTDQSFSQPQQQSGVGQQQAQNSQFGATQPLPQQPSPQTQNDDNATDITQLPNQQPPAGPGGYSSQRSSL